MMRESEAFKRTSPLDHSLGRNVPQYTIMCSKCTAEDHIRVTKSAGSLAVELVKKAFHNRGWVIGNKRKNDICPSCVARGRAVKIMGKNIKVVEMEKNQTPKQLAEAHFTPSQNGELKHPRIAQHDPTDPRASLLKEPSKEQKRSIMSMIQDNYHGEKHGYTTGITDASIAVALGGIPVSWVTDIRDEFFGPAVNENHPDIKLLIDEIDAIGKELPLFKDAIDRLTESEQRLTLRLRALEKRTDQLRGKG